MGAIWWKGILVRYWTLARSHTGRSGLSGPKDREMVLGRAAPGSPERYQKTTRI